MSSPLPYFHYDQDIFHFVDPDDLRHIYKEDQNASPNIADTSWNNNMQTEQNPATYDFSASPHKTPSERLRERAQSSPTYTRLNQPGFPFFSTIPLSNSPKRRISAPELSSAKFAMGDSENSQSFEEDNGMEFFDAVTNNTDQSVSEVEREEDSSYDMDVIPNSSFSSEHDNVAKIKSEILNNNKLNAKQKNFKLGSSKSPVIDALVYCALTKQGLCLIEEGSRIVQFRMDDFPLYYSKSRGVCSKAHPTDDLNSRVKALQRWFPDFPTLKELARGLPCVFSLLREKNHVNFAKMQVILERVRHLLKAQNIIEEESANQMNNITNKSVLSQQQQQQHQIEVWRNR